jgi:hypothetical protein
MKNYSRLILVIPFVLISCKKEVQPKENSTTRVIPFTEVGNQMRNEAAAKNAALPNQNSNATSSSGATTGELNPPHGQAGHRCDLAVGAPLNSSVPAVTNSNTVTVPKMKVAPTITNTTPTAPTTPTPEGMNPPHGQDGHRCDIAVGAALPK